MKRINYSILLLIYWIPVLVGCQRVDQRADPVVTAPPRAMPAQDIPPVPERENTYIQTSVKPPFQSVVPAEAIASLLYQAKSDLLRILICSEEQVQLSSEKYNSDVLLQEVSEHFSDMGILNNLGA